jgi:MFS family permease
MKPLHLHIVLSTCNHLAFTGARLTVMLYAASLDVSPALIGVLAGSFGVVGAFTSVSVGRLIDRVGPRRPMMFASLMMFCGGALAAAWDGVAALYLICPLLGTFNGMFQIATQQTIGRYGDSRERVANFAQQSLGIAVSTFSGPLVAGLAIDHFGHGASFMILALCGVVPLPVIAFGWLKFPDAAPRAPKEAGYAGVRRLLGDSKLGRIYVVAAVNNATWSVVSFLIPLYGAHVGLSATLIGGLMACFATGTVAIRVALQFLVRRFRPWQLVIVSQSLVAISFVGIPMTQHFAILLPLLFVMGAGLGMSGPMSTALLTEASPPERVGEVVGLRITLANITQTVVPFASGAVSAALGVAPVFWAVAAVLFGVVYWNRAEVQKGG